MVGGRGVRLADEVALGDEELYVCVDVDAAGGEALVRQASAVEREWLPPDRITTETVVEFDEASGKVIARRRVAFDGLVLEETQAALPAQPEKSPPRSGGCRQRATRSGVSCRRRSGRRISHARAVPVGVDAGLAIADLDDDQLPTTAARAGCRLPFVRGAAPRSVAARR